METAFIAILTCSCVAIACAGDPVTEQMMMGADISALPVLEEAGASYSYRGTTGDAIEILARSGVTWSRLRLFVEPSADQSPIVVNDLSYTIALAKRVKAAGNKLLLDIHYSDTWADPGKQFKPKAWESLNMEELRLKVLRYTQETIAAFKNEGVLPEMVQVGNEISNGMLWPEGRLGVGESRKEGFDRLASLLKAGVDGVRLGAGPQDQVQIMIHFDNCIRLSRARVFFDQLVDHKLDFDVIGYSYHPYHHYNSESGDGGLEDLAMSLSDTALRYEKPIVIVETSFPSRKGKSDPSYEFEISSTGQKQFLESLISTVALTPNNLGLGVFWWYPEAVPLKGLRVRRNGRYGLFDSQGELLPAASAFTDRRTYSLPN